jgi:hypothetical protein
LSDSFLGLWEAVVDSSFALDLFLNFRTAFVTDSGDFLVTSAPRIATHYLQGFFLIDFLSTVPWDVVMTNESLGLVQLFKVSKVIKLVRILRVLKLIRILRLLKARPYSQQGVLFVHVDMFCGTMLTGFRVLHS